MSTSFPKSKEKRPRSSSEPNKSFVKNVTSRVSGLLPATITKWFSSPSSSNKNGSAQVADATDSSTEDEAPESPISLQPPAKKIRYTSPGEFSQHVPVETRCTSTNTESIDETFTIHSPIGRTNSRGENIFASTRVHISNDDTSEENTQEAFFKPQHSLSAIEPSTANKRKSLFGTPQEDITRHGHSNSGNVRDPYFKPSLLSSPFYVGRTMYGGSSSSYLTPTSFKKKNISLTNETSDDDSVTMSHSARRVMDLLEHYSSPLIEAKRIPQMTRDSDLLNNRSLPQSVNPYGPKVYSYKTQELYVPSVASILTIKRKARLMESTNAARQIIASHSSSSDLLPYPISNSGGDVTDDVAGDKLTTKVKSRLTRTNRDRNMDLECTAPETVNLPNVVLQIDKDNLPKFTFGPVSKPQQSSSIQTPVIITPEILKRNSEADKSDFSKTRNAEKDKPLVVKNNNDYYKFSRPVPVSNESNKLLDISSVPKFKLSSTKKVSDPEKPQQMKTKDDQTSLNTSNQSNLDNKFSVTKSLDWKCLDCWVMNKMDNNTCVCCGGKKPVVLDSNDKKCSTCNVSIDQSQCTDKCSECEKKTKSSNDNLFVTKDMNTWRCSDCWVNNKENADKCICCGGRNRNQNKPAPVVCPENNVESEWKCNDCWIKNKNSLSKCAACGGLKPGSQSTTTNNLGSSVFLKVNNVKEINDSTFKNIAKSQNERWECPLCLVRNESSRDTCICCEASKPGTEKDSQTKFNFHQPSEITFKFGIQPKIPESCTDIETEECNMGEESETNNNVLPKTPTFNFGLRVKNVEALSQLDKLAEAPKLNFTFGASKGDQVSVNNTIFGIPNKPAEISKINEEKPQEVPQVFTHSPTNEPAKKSLGLFNSTVSSHVAPEMPGLLPMHQMNQNSIVKKDVSFQSIIPTTSSEAKTQQNSFTFPNIMPATNLFAATPTTTSSVSNVLPGVLSMSIPASTTISLFQKPNVTTTTSSFFQKTETVPALGVSMFSKTESTTPTTTTTTNSGSLGTMPPIFSFGSHGSAPQAEKPKFNFNFSNNKTEPAPMFNPTFGATSDNSITNNKFNLPSNPIIGGNTLSGNPINNTTQMNTANPLTTGNSLTTSTGSTIFGTSVPKENMWPASNNNIFANNNTTNGEQKPAAFTFGATSSFNTNSAPFGSSAPQAQPNNAVFGSTTQPQTNNITFGSTAQQAPTNVPFGSATQQSQQNNNVPFGNAPQQAQPNNNVPFGSNPQQAQATQPQQNVFGITNQTPSSQPPMFGNHLQNQAPPSMFGGLQVPNNPMPMGLFGTPNQVPPPSFGALNPPIPTFETTSLAQSQPAPGAFNFGGQPSTAIFGFGQQQQPGQPPAQPENQPGIYGFGGTPGAAPQVQFTIGSAPNTAGRRVRKAMRRTQR